jgi:hypothetical protein
MDEGFVVGHNGDDLSGDGECESRATGLQESVSRRRIVNYISKFSSNGCVCQLLGTRAARAAKARPYCSVKLHSVGREG